MYTRATIVTGINAEETLQVRRVLIDTGAHGGNYIGRAFLQANRDALRLFIKSSDTSVFLADGVTELKIDESLDLTLIVTTFSGKVVTISTNFGVIESMCDLILGLNVMVLQGGDMLIEMVKRAVDFGKLEEAEQRERSTLLLLDAQDRPQSDAQLQPFKPTTTTRFPPSSRFPEPQPINVERLTRPLTTDSANETEGEKSVRAPLVAHSSASEPEQYIRRPWFGGRNSLSNIIVGGAQAVQDLPMIASEPGQVLRRPWSKLLERGPEEDDTSFEGSFADQETLH